MLKKIPPLIVVYCLQINPSNPLKFSICLAWNASTMCSFCMLPSQFVFKVKGVDHINLYISRRYWSPTLKWGQSLLILIRLFLPFHVCLFVVQEKKSSNWANYFFYPFLEQNIHLLYQHSFPVWSLISRNLFKNFRRWLRWTK